MLKRLVDSLKSISQSVGLSNPNEVTKVLYEVIGKELANGNVKPGLMARAIAESNGDEGRSRSLYIKYRLAEIKEEFHQELLEAAQKDLLLLMKSYGAFPEILQELRDSAPNFDYLMFIEKKAAYLKYETPKKMYDVACMTHYEKDNIEQAVVYYRALIERFPESKESQ